MNRKRYLFFDIDGTLLAGGYHDTYIPDSTVLALEKCRAAGHFLCIATGRLQAMAVDCMHELGFTNMVSDGGYGITIDDKFYGAIPLPGEPVVRLIDECDALNDMSMFTDDWTKVAMGNACPELKAKADLITTNVEDDGIYNACVTLGLF